MYEWKRATIRLEDIREFMRAEAKTAVELVALSRPDASLTPPSCDFAVAFLRKEAYRKKKAKGQRIIQEVAKHPETLKARARGARRAVITYVSLPYRNAICSCLSRSSTLHKYSDKRRSPLRRDRRNHVQVVYCDFREPPYKPRRDVKHIHIFL